MVVVVVEEEMIVLYKLIRPIILVTILPVCEPG
jgi:hypothetical protein